jgi:hypothetical protein
MNLIMAVTLAEFLHAGADAELALVHPDERFVETEFVCENGGVDPARTRRISNRVVPVVSSRGRTLARKKYESRGVCSPRLQMSLKTDTMSAVTRHRLSGGTFCSGL